MRLKQGRKSHLLREKTVAKEVHNNWEISYGDMITLLLGFFILFFNIKQDRVNMKLIVNRLEKKFNKATGESLTTGVQQKQMSTKNLLATPSLQKYKLLANISGEKLYIEFPGVSFFDIGKTELTAEGSNALDQFASSLDKNIGSVRLVIRGYTDNTPSKKATDNLELSARRSLSAIRHLNKKGVDLKYMRIGGYGESDLSDRRVAASERRLDRKIVIVVEPLDAAERGHEVLNRNAEPVAEKKPQTQRQPASLEKAPWWSRSQLFYEGPPQQEVDAWMSEWVEKTALYKKINPYSEDKTANQTRGSK
jgi:chemotaxis protein MotB